MTRFYKITSGKVNMKLMSPVEMYHFGIFEAFRHVSPGRLQIFAILSSFSRERMVAVPPLPYGVYHCHQAGPRAVFPTVTTLLCFQEHLDSFCSD